MFIPFITTTTTTTFVAIVIVIVIIIIVIKLYNKVKKLIPQIIFMNKSAILR
jgi:hypothetical protein